jgi:hypothetical protein
LLKEFTAAAGAARHRLGDADFGTTASPPASITLPPVVGFRNRGAKRGAAGFQLNVVAVTNQA